MEFNDSVTRATTRFNCDPFIVTSFNVNMICFTMPSSEEISYLCELHRELGKNTKLKTAFYACGGGNSST